MESEAGQDLAEMQGHDDNPSHGTATSGHRHRASGQHATGLPRHRHFSEVPECVPLDDPRRIGIPVNVPVFVEREHYCLTVQPFTGGGYEATVKLVDAQRIADRRCLIQERRPRSPRAEPERDGRNVLRAQIRAKKRVRHLCKEMGADRILTLTTREQSNTPDQMLARWQHWLRLVERASKGRFHYVAVLEPHPSNPGHLHMHVAVAVFLNVDILRRCWWEACGGRAMGNIHIKRLKAGEGIRRVYKVASYISKYLTKETTVAFNRKRYWASRVNLPEVRRYWLKSRTLLEAVSEACFGLNYWNFEGKGTFYSESNNVAWFEAVPDMPLFGCPF